MITIFYFLLTEDIDCVKYIGNIIVEADKLREKCLNAAAMLKTSFLSQLIMYIAYGVVALLLFVALFAFFRWQSKMWHGKSLVKFTSETVLFKSLFAFC